MKNVVLFTLYAILVLAMAAGLLGFGWWGVALVLDKVTLGRMIYCGLAVVIAPIGLFCSAMALFEGYREAFHTYQSRMCRGC
jgi:hypothetical protein